MTGIENKGKAGCGTLYLCATPIGNLGDITARVLDTLAAVDVIAAEDTRNTRHLLTHFDIHTKLTSYHEHNRVEKAGELISLLESGQDIALVTDAGTPAISDPGEVLVDLCHEAGIPVTSLPGPSAVITALSLSGISARRFAFEGFLPGREDKKTRRTILEALKEEPRTIVLYEAPHHLRALLADLSEALGGGRRLAVCRELTKRFEEVTRTTLSEADAFYRDNEPRGEYVLVIEGIGLEGQRQRAQKAWEEMSVADHVAHYEAQGLDRKEAMKCAARDRGISKSEVYKELL
ncbi:MAG: 16S rRNA (cytidine(1402)-2'-O)-methyltransferase [Lachnospiraceae bacterium]|nr:16S rRNA (cytidine(1402)-2'-O)-methyltransferase [Lachnospiraceae bacterium]